MLPLLLALAPATVHANDITDDMADNMADDITVASASADELFFDMPVVLSANRLEQPVSNAAVTISVIDRETIEASGARYIPELLRLIPGMQVGFSGNEFGDEPKFVVTYHGHSDQYSKQMQVLIDGRSIYDPYFGGINWKAIPININDIERIEVSRGPNLATYGANSFMAAINIITRTAAEDQGVYVQSNVGNNGVRDFTGRFGGSAGKLDYRVTVSTYNDHGQASGNQYTYPNDTNSHKFDYRIDYQFDSRNSLSWQGGYGHNRQQADRNHGGLIPVERTVKNVDWYQFLKWESVIDNRNTLLVQYYYNRYDKTETARSDPITIPLPAPLNQYDTFTIDRDAGILSQRHNLELTHFYTPNEALKLVWGLSGQYDKVETPFYLKMGKADNHKLRGFANIEWRFAGSNTLNLGGLAEKNSFSPSELSPRISLTHQFNKRHSLRIGVSKAIRSPFLYEARGDVHFAQTMTIGGQPPPVLPPPLPALPDYLYEQAVLGNEMLDNERIISREIAYYGSFLDASLLLNARLFHDTITNYIDTLREPVDQVLGNNVDNVPDDLTQLGDPNPKNTVHVFQNAVDSTTNGLEIELDYRIDPGLRLIGSGAIINISSHSDAISRSAPQHSYSLLLSKSFNAGYYASLGYYYTGAFKWMDVRGGTEKYDALDARLGRHIRLGQTQGSLSLVLRNLSGDYSDYQTQPSGATAPRVISNKLAYIDLRLSF